MTHTVKNVRIDKIWVSDAEHMIWQLHDRDRNQRFFLAIGIDQQKAHAKWSLQKPTFTPKPHPITELLRKYGPQGMLTHFIPTEKNQGWIIGLKMRHHHPMALLISGGKENGFNLLELNEEKILSIVRVAQGKTYTKRHAVEREEIAVFLDPILTSEFIPFEVECDIPTDEEPEHESSKQHDFVRALRRRLRTLNKSLQQLPSTSESELQNLEKKAKLLQSFMHLIKPEQVELELKHEQTGEQENVLIELDPEHTPSQNVAMMFSRVKKLRKQIEHTHKHKKNIQHSIIQIEDALNQLNEKNISPETIQQMSVHLGLKSPLVSSSGGASTRGMQKSALRNRDHSKNGRSYAIGDYVITVGRNAEENDRLTKYAKANDYWFHVAQASGSHVIIAARRKADNLNEHHPVVRAASILALHFSSRRSHRQGEVLFTQRRHLTKSKGHALGEWTVRTGKTLSIQYEEVELRQILDQVLT